jgi:hypothetical protein
MKPKKMMGVMKKAPLPLMKAVGEFKACSTIGCATSADKEACLVKCTKDHIKKVDDILDWAKLGRCQMEAFLCSVDDGDECMTALKKCTHEKAPEGQL